MKKITLASEAIQLFTDEAEGQGADANDSTGVVRALVSANLPGRSDAQFYAWFSVCIGLADRAAQKEGYASAVIRAYTIAKASLPAGEKKPRTAW